jgi:hypothetical protein
MSGRGFSPGPVGATLRRLRVRLSACPPARAAASAFAAMRSPAAIDARHRVVADAIARREAPGD